MAGARIALGHCPASVYILEIDDSDIMVSGDLLAGNLLPSAVAQSQQSLSTSVSHRIESRLFLNKGDGKKIEQFRPINITNMTRVLNDLQDTVSVFADNLLERR